MAEVDIPHGGFLLSPPASSIISSTANSQHALPHPRNAPLRPGGSKWSAFIRYVDQQLLHIQRRFAKRTTTDVNVGLDNGINRSSREGADDWGDVKGYKSMREACKDLSDLMGVVWVSGTPSLQIPYLLNIGLLLHAVITAMPPSPRSLFRLLGRLDHAFASLLQGRDVETGEALPGFEGRTRVSGTEKVRIRSLVERTRVGVMEAFKRGEFEYEDGDEIDRREAAGDGEDSDMDDGLLVLEGEGDGEEEEDESWNVQLSKVYDATIVELGDSLEEPNLGVVTEGRGAGAGHGNLIGILHE